MASRMLGLSSLGGRAAGARCSPARHANAPPAVSLTQTMSHVHAAFTAAVNNGGDAAPATGSEEDRERTTMDEEDPVSRAAEKAADVAGKVRGVAEEVKEAGREVKDRAREVGEDVKESVKQTRP